MEHARVEPAELAGGLLDELYAIYCSALAIDPAADRSRAWRDSTLPTHARRDGFAFLVAREDGTVVGLAYGYTGTYGQWWTDRVARALDEAARRAWLDPPHYEVVEVHVRPGHQRRGIGRRLLEALLAAQPHDRALLTAIRDDARAQAFYAALGWQRLGEVGFGDEAPPYLVLGKMLR